MKILRYGNNVLEVPETFKIGIVEFIEVNGVLRPTCRYAIKNKDNTWSFVNFDTLMSIVVNERLDRLGIAKYHSSLQDLVKNKKGDVNFIPFLVRTVQKYINSIVNALPLHKTMMNSWSVNQRIHFLDPDFDNIVDPAEVLQYQLYKADRYFDRGWTLMGLSDSNLADCNYIFTEDLRKYTPFGLKHHNPQRNLYQTLGMKGDELPALRTSSQQKLIIKGVPRRGWNVTTLFLDVPLNFEDQILIRRSFWEDKFVKTTKTYTIYGEVVVEEGEELSTNQVIGVHLDGNPESVDVLGEKHVVKKISDRIAVVNGSEVKTKSVVIETTRYFKEGFKLTNTHGNKGIVRFFEDGEYIIHDPVKGDIQPDVVVSLKSVTKRKNFGQIAEAIFNRVFGITRTTPAVIPDDLEASPEQLKQILQQAGWEKETSPTTTPYGEVEAIWGPVFWGCIKTPEENVWSRREILHKNSRGHYTKGLKFSHMEFRALLTLFGPKNPIIKEILSYANTGDYLNERLKMLQYNPEGPSVDYTAFNVIDPASGITHPKEDFKGTIVDPDCYPNGIVIRIPAIDITVGRDEITLTGLYLPKADVRKYWNHRCGLVAADTTFMALNNALYHLPRDIKLARLWLERYFEAVAKSIGSKVGDIAQKGMAVRYPKSFKATAVGSDTLPKNTIEIHKYFADFLGVKTGDPVLVERFPCLGFMSIRPQYVKVTTDPDCRFTIRVSGNSLVSENLDFDGDTLYVAAFDTLEAKQALIDLLEDSGSYINKVIERMNNKKRPMFMWGGFDELNMITFPKLTKEKHHEIVSKAVGVKAHTGPVIATAYNLMRIAENYYGFEDQKLSVDIEVMLDFLGNTVFSQKHGVTPLHDKAVNAICCGDVDTMAAMGFDRTTSEKVIFAVKHYAKQLGVTDLVKYHNQAKEQGRSNIINRIVREYNKIYFASRSILAPSDTITCLNAKAVDAPSALFKVLTKTS